MSKQNLSSRLNEIENEIKSMLNFQKCESLKANALGRSIRSRSLQSRKFSNSNKEICNCDIITRASSVSPTRYRTDNLISPFSTRAVPTGNEFDAEIMHHIEESRNYAKSQQQQNVIGTPPASRDEQNSCECAPQPPARWNSKVECNKSSPLCMCSSESFINDMSMGSNNLRDGYSSHADACICESTLKALQEESHRRKSAEKMVNELQAEMENVKLQVNEMAESKRMAIDMTKELKDKYEFFRDAHKNVTMKLSNLQLQNSELCNCIDSEITFKKMSADYANQDLLSCRKEVENRLDNIQVQTIQSSKKLASQYEKLFRKLKQRDEEIKKIKVINCTLHKRNSLKEEQQKRIQSRCEKLKSQLDQYNEHMRKLTEENERLSKIVSTIQQRLEEVEKENKMYKIEMSNCQALMKVSDGEVEKLKQQLTNKICAKVQQQREHLVSKLRESKERERGALEQVRTLTSKFQELQYIVSVMKKSETELKLLVEEHKKLQNKYNDLMVKMKNVEAQDNQKCQIIEEEMRKLKQITFEKEKVLLKEKAELRSLVQELTEIVKRHKQRILELESLNREQEILLQSQKNAIIDRDERLRYTEIQSESIKRRSAQLERQIALFKTSIETFDNLQSKYEESKRQNERVEEVIRELQEVRDKLNEQKDKVLLKQKIIDDQSNTIEKLKRSISEKESEIRNAHNEAKCCVEKMQKSLECVNKTTQELSKEKQEKQQLREELCTMKTRKKQLQDQICELECCVENFCKAMPVIDCQKQQELIDSLKKQILMQQEEWELHKEIMTKEKMQAFNAAKFATEKLIDTVEDFQEQVESQKEVQTILTQLLQEKDGQLKAITAKDGTDKKKSPSLPCECLNSSDSSEKFSEEDITNIIKDFINKFNIKTSHFHTSSSVRFSKSSLDRIIEDVINEENEECVCVRPNAQWLSQKLANESQKIEDQKRGFKISETIPEESESLCACDACQCDCDCPRSESSPEDGTIEQDNSNCECDSEDCNCSY